MSSDHAIVIDGLGKSYAISAPGALSGTLREAIVHRARHPLHRRTSETFWALRDIDLEVSPGEVIGIIGGNGAGKSTLLKILSRITEPTVGRAELRGRVGSLLEVGTGFHPELTGRENVYLNGAILGMRRAEIDRHFNDIVDFAGIGQFLDTPVKRYSSGMYVRLAFAVAAHLQPEILIVDEVLAVGDAEFQRRCLGKMESAANEEGRTILFVSHNLAAVESLCTRAIHLRDGRVAFDGAVDDAVSSYLGATDDVRRDLTSSGGTSLRTVALVDAHGRDRSQVRMGDPASIRIEMTGLVDPKNVLFGMHIRSAGSLIASVSSRMFPTALSEAADQTVVIRFPRLSLAPGPYTVDLGLKRRHEGGFLEFVPNALAFEVVASDVYGSGYLPTAHDGLVFLGATIDPPRPGIGANVQREPGARGNLASESDGGRTW